jgi:ERCC4-type nuclease
MTLQLPEPIIAIDTREQTPWAFKTPTVAETLPCGDYSLLNCSQWLAVERKSLSDLIACLSFQRDRFVKELERARRIPNFSVIIEGLYSDILKGRYRSKITPASVWGSTIAMQERHRIPFYFAENSEIAAKLCESILLRWWREHLKVFESVERTTKKKCLTSIRVPRIEPLCEQLAIKEGKAK